jgi:hypothetical protein
MTYTLGVRRRETGSDDDHGNAEATYGAAEDWVVRGYAPGANNEGGDPARDLSNILWTVYADASDDVPGELDLVVLEGDEYAVEGRPADWTHGPWFNPVAGVVVELKRAEG